MVGAGVSEYEKLDNKHRRETNRAERNANAWCTDQDAILIGPGGNIRPEGSSIIKGQKLLRVAIVGINQLRMYGIRDTDKFGKDRIVITHCIMKKQKAAKQSDLDLTAKRYAEWRTVNEQ